MVQPISTIIPGQFSTAPVSARSFLQTPSKSGSIIRRRNRLFRHRVTLKAPIQHPTIVSANPMTGTDNREGLPPGLTPIGKVTIRSPRQHKASLTDMTTLRCSTVCSQSARLTMHRRKPSTARCSDVKRRNVVARNSNCKFQNPSKYVTTRR